MATIVKIPRKNNKLVYKVIIRQDGIKPFSKTFKSKKSAQLWAARLDSDIDLARAEANPLLRKMTVGDLITEYLDQHTGKDRSIYGRLAWWKDQAGDIAVGKLTKQVIRPILNDYAAGKARSTAGRRFIGGKLTCTTRELNRTRSGSTVNRMRAALESVLVYGRAHHDLAIDPFKDLPRSKEGSPRKRFLSDAERATLLTECRKSEWNRLWLMVAVAVTSGARQGELLGLRWSDIDWDGNRGNLRDTKNGSSRNIHLVDLVMDELRQFREIGSGLIFPSVRKPDRPFEFRKHWDRALKDSGITDFRFHDLRHSAASYLLTEGGCSLPEIGAVLGHKSVASTNRYSHLADQKANDLVRSVASKALG